MASHQSKAASGYYVRYFGEYLAALTRSVAELGRVVRKGGQVAIVVQGSFFKEVPLDLDVVVSEALVECGFQVVRTQRHEARNRAQVNPGARRYRSEFSMMESVIFARA